jgi:hypothetical protein
MPTKLSDLPLRRLLRILRDTRRALGPDAPTVQVLRRAIDAKRASAGKEAARAS